MTELFQIDAEGVALGNVFGWFVCPTGKQDIGKWFVGSHRCYVNGGYGWCGRLYTAEASARAALAKWKE